MPVLTGLNTAEGKSHQKPDLSSFYRYRHESVHLDEQEFRIVGIIPGQKRRLPLDGVTDSISWRWERGDPVLHGSIAFSEPDHSIDRLAIREGHRVRLDVRWAGMWHEVFTMRLYQTDLDWGGDLSFDLHDDGYLLQISRDDWSFVKGKRKPTGWRAHEIAIFIARRYKIKLGRVVKGRRQIKHLTMQDASPMQVLQRAYALERNETGNRYVIRMHRGELEITPMRRNPMLYTLGLGQLTEGSTTREEPNDKWATALTVRSSSKRGSSRKPSKIETTYYDKKRIKRYGVIHKQVTLPGIDSEAEAQTRAKRHIAKHAIRKPTIAFSGPGMAFIRRGDAVRVSNPERGITGKRGIVFVADIEHSISGGDYQMTGTAVFDDPHEEKKEQARRNKDEKND